MMENRSAVAVQVVASGSKSIPDTMKFTTVAAFFLPAVMASPTGGNGIVKRQTAVTDELIFSISLPAFISRRNARDPPSLDWSSDSCSTSPDNPFGYPFDRE